MPNKSIKVNFTCLVIGTSLVVLLISCQKIIKDEQREKVIRAVDKLHAQFNEKRFAEIYIESKAEFRASISESKFVEQLSKWRQEFGEINKDEQNKIDPIMITVDSSTQTARLTVFNGKKGIGNLTEEFVWDISDKEAKLVNYKIFEVFKAQ